MPKIKSVVEIINQLNKIYLRLAYGKSDIDITKKQVNDVVKEDRLSHKEAIVGALEGMKKLDLPSSLKDTVGFCKGIGHNQALDQAIAIVNSIYKDSE